MTPLLSLVLIVILAYVGTVFFQNPLSKSLIIKGLSLSGLHYLILGFILGPNIFNLLNSNILNELSVIQSFVLGWTGFLIGLQINFKQMKRFQQNYYWTSLGNFVFVFLMIFTGSFALCSLLQLKIDLFQIIVLTVATSISSPLIIGVLKKEYNLRGNFIHYIQFQSAYDNMLGIIIIGLVLSWYNYLALEVTKIMMDISIAVIIVILLALLFYYITKEIKNVQQYFLIIIGFLLLIVGTALQLKQSSLFIAFLFGFALANLPINTWKLFQTISNTEKPIYLLLLIFIGANIVNINVIIIVSGILFTLWRMASKYLGGQITLLAFYENKKKRTISSLMGIGMSGVSLAIILDYKMLSGTSNIEILVGIIITSFFINDGLAFVITNPLLKNSKTYGIN